MYVLRTVASLREFLEEVREEGGVVGFVPTMGALHTGHETLVMTMLDECNCGVTSIFVNPAQFNDPADLEKYPRPIENDIDKLNDLGCDVLFLPAVEEIYPTGSEENRDLDLAGLDIPMEGAFRPGHFTGVARVMYRLLNIVQPDRLYMGQKDFQQTAIIRHIIRSHQMPVDFVMCPTVRESDGLALSSRNVRIEPADRAMATSIYQVLNMAKQQLGDRSIGDIKEEAMTELTRSGLRPEYFEIVDGASLEAVTEPDEHEQIVACTAAWLGEVRLIDNMILRG